MEYSSANNVDGWNPNKMKGENFVGEKISEAEKLGKYGERTEIADPERPVAAQEQGTDGRGSLAGEQGVIAGGAEQGPLAGEQGQNNGIETEKKSGPLMVQFGEMPAGVNIEQNGNVTPMLGAMPPDTDDTSEAVAMSTEMSNKDYRRMVGDTISKEHYRVVKKVEEQYADDPYLMEENYARERDKSLEDWYRRRIGDGNGVDIPRMKFGGGHVASSGLGQNGPNTTPTPDIAPDINAGGIEPPQGMAA